MGLNLVWTCVYHRQQSTSMRGEEGYDFQFLARAHKTCFRRGLIEVRVDSDVDRDESMNELWEYENRPAVLSQEDWLALKDRGVR